MSSKPIIFTVAKLKRLFDYIISAIPPVQQPVLSQTVYLLCYCLRASELHHIQVLFYSSASLQEMAEAGASKSSREETIGRRGMPFQLRVQYENEAKSKNKKGMSLAVIRFDDGKRSPSV